MSPIKKLAISYCGQDCLRIIPTRSLGRTQIADIKISHIHTPYLIKKHIWNNDKSHLLFTTQDISTNPAEISYHSATSRNPSPSLLPKFQDKRPREPFSHDITSIDLRYLPAPRKGIFIPIPICRITINDKEEREYKPNKNHQNVSLTQEENTVDIYITSNKFDPQLNDRICPGISLLSNMSSIDYLLYGGGLADGITRKMMRTNGPTNGFTSVKIGDHTLIWKTYTLPIDVKSKAYHEKAYSERNIIEFFDNTNYIQLLGITPMGYESLKNSIKPTYLHDADHMKAIGIDKAAIRRFKKIFENKELLFKTKGKMISGILWAG